MTFEVEMRQIMIMKSDRVLLQKKIFFFFFFLKSGFERYRDYRLISVDSVRI